MTETFGCKHGTESEEQFGGAGGNSLEVQRLGLLAFKAKGADSIPGREIGIPPAVRLKQNNHFGANLCVASCL